jgi:two-component system OmpR family sensor kinase
VLSLRARLLVAIGVVALVAVAVTDLVTYTQIRGFLDQQVSRSLDQSTDQASHLVASGHLLICGLPGHGFSEPGAHPDAGNGGGTAGGPGAAEGVQGTGGNGGTSGSGANPPRPSNSEPVVAIEVRDRSGAVVGGQQCAAYVDGTPYLPAVPHPVPGLSGTHPVSYFDTGSTTAGGPPMRVRATVLADGEVLIVAQPLSATEGTLHRLLLVELVVSAVAVAAALAGGWWLVRLGLRPLRDMESTAEAVARGDLTERVPGESDRTEVGRLARTLNTMLARIQSAFDARLASERRARASEQRLRRFVADASHELRTPIAAVAAYAELFGRGASSDPADLERVMTGIRSETGRMEHLVADLLQLARLDEGRPLDVVPIDLVALCAGAVGTATTVAPGWPVRVEATEPIEVRGDERALRQAVDNLLANVRQHTPEGTTTTVGVRRDGAQALVVVADTGPGFGPDDAAHLFERFYRVDPSRARSRGGAGLGLSIVDAIVSAHGGSVSVESTPGRGATFTLRLPLSGGPAVPVVGDAAPNAAPEGPEGLQGVSGPGGFGGPGVLAGPSGQHPSATPDGSAGRANADGGAERTTATPPIDPGR